MKRLLLLALLPAMALAQAPKDETGFTSITPDKELTGWKSVGGNGKFESDGKEVVGTGKNVNANTFLISEKTYKDFDFRFEMKFDTLKGNSGMMFRGLQKESKDGNGRVYGYQCEHDNGKGRAWTAGLYDEARRGWLFPDKNDKGQSAAFTKQGQEVIKWDDWNDIRIVCEGNHIRIWINGEERVDYTDTDKKESTLEGFFGMQVHAGGQTDVRWRNLRIKEL